MPPPLREAPHIQAAKIREAIRRELWRIPAARLANARRLVFQQRAGRWELEIDAALNI